jgi:glutaconate CoA-transferase subunit A
VADKRMTEEDVVAELRDGMTIGIAGWGSRRKPMSIVRAILRSDLKDLTIVAYGGPDVGMLCAAGKVRKAVYGFVSLDSIPPEPTSGRCRTGPSTRWSLDEGMLQRAGAASELTSCRRAGLGSAITEINPALATVRSPYCDDEYLAMPALTLDVALLHANRADARGNAQYLGPDWYFDDLFAMAAERTFVSCERVVEPGGFLAEGPESTIRINRMFTTGVVEAPHGAHFTHCVPDYERDEAFQREYADSAKSPEAGPSSARSTSTSRGRLPPRDGVARERRDPSEICAVACAEAWRGSGEVLASPIGTIPTIARGSPLHVRARPRLRRRRRRAIGRAADRAPSDAEKVVEAWLPFGKMFDIVVGQAPCDDGRDADRPLGNQNIACIGPWAKPKAQLLGVRGAGKHREPPDELLGARARTPCSSSRSIACSASTTTAPTPPGRPAVRFHHIHHVVEQGRLRLRDRRPLDADPPAPPRGDCRRGAGVTSFPLVVPANVPESRLPTDEELQLIREVLDPTNAALRRCSSNAPGAAHAVL